MNPKFIDRKLRRIPTVTRILTNLLRFKESSTSNVVGVETKAIANIGRSDHKVTVRMRRASRWKTKRTQYQEGAMPLGKNLQGSALVPFPVSQPIDLRCPRQRTGGTLDLLIY
jgi:hypothetical protein